MSNFETAFKAYFEGCQKITTSKYPDETLRFERLQKRIRVWCGPMAHSFVDLVTGDVLFCAGWKAPAKGARGNIFDEHHGLGRMGPHGPATNTKKKVAA